MKSFTDMYLESLNMITFLDFTKSNEELNKKMKIFSIFCKEQTQLIESKFNYFKSGTFGKRSLACILDSNDRFDLLKEEFNYTKNVVDDVPQHILFNL